MADDFHSHRIARRALARERQLRRRRAGAVLGALGVAVLILIVVLATSSGGGRRTVAHKARARTAAAVAGNGDVLVSAAGRLPAAVQDAATATLPDGRVVLLGGRDAAGRSTARITILGPTGAVSGGRLPQVQHDAAAATLGGAVYVFGGGDVNQYDHILRYDPASGQTTTVGRLPRTNSDDAVAAIGNTAYIVGGYDGSVASRDILAWQPGGSARVVGQLPQGVRYAAVAAAGGRLVIAGGSVAGGASRAVYGFDPATGAVTRIAQLPSALTHAAAATLGRWVYVIGGRGAASGSAGDKILAIDPASGRVRSAGTLTTALSDSSAATLPNGTITLAGGNDGAISRAQLSSLRLAPPLPAPSVAVPGDILIADRGNNRMLLVNPQGRIVWRFPDAADKRAGRRLNFDDDVFVAPGGAQVVANEEDSHVIVAVDVATHALHVLYGHYGVSGTAPGFLHTPDDAYPLAGGVIQVADAYNCRIIFIRGHRIIRQYGRTGACYHDPPRAFGDVNGDTPTPDGGVLVSEVNGSWIDYIDANGRLGYAFKAPVSYPSDPQPLSGGRILLADYANPGHILILDQSGHALWRYGPTSGPGRLDHPSLAALLPNGFIAVNDDYRARIIVIDPTQNRIVWQYGSTGHPGTAAGHLNIPDGLDFIPVTKTGQPNWAATVQPLVAAPVLVG